MALYLEDGKFDCSSFMQLPGYLFKIDYGYRSDAFQSFNLHVID